MSRMTKFLQQSCTLEQPKRNRNGSTRLNKFGDIVYEQPVVVKCRREKILKDVLTNTGAIVRSSTRYFTDESRAIQVDDKLDGQVVIQVEEYVNALGITEGFESYV